MDIQLVIDGGLEPVKPDRSQMDRIVRIGHELLNHKGDHIFVTKGTMKALDMRGYLGRDRATGLKYFDPKGYELIRDGEVGTPWWYELGPDLSGPNVATCNCEHCRERRELGDARLSEIKAEQVVEEARASRRERKKIARSKRGRHGKSR